MGGHPELGSGEVEYRKNRPIIHFGSSAADIETAMRARAEDEEAAK